MSNELGFKMVPALSLICGAREGQLPAVQAARQDRLDLIAESHLGTRGEILPSRLRRRHFHPLPESIRD